MKQLSSYRKEQIEAMLEHSTQPIELNDVCFESNVKNSYGAVITPDGKVLALKYYGTHGVVSSLLFPSVAEHYQIPMPTGDSIEDVPKQAYQEFDLSMGYRMPLIRIATGLNLNISHGRGEFWPNAAQVESLRLYLIENNLMNAEVFSELLVSSPKKLLQALRDGEEETNYVKIMDASERDD